MRTSALQLCIYSLEKYTKIIPAQTIISLYNVILALSAILRYLALRYSTSALHENTSAGRSTMKVLTTCLALFGGKSC